LKSLQVLVGLWLVLSLLTVFSAIQINLSGDLVTGKVVEDNFVTGRGIGSYYVEPTTVEVALKAGWNMVSLLVLSLKAVDASNCDLHN